MLLTRIRPEHPRNERATPESVICRCVFEDRRTALWTAYAWTASRPVRTGRERVKIVIVGD